MRPTRPCDANRWLPRFGKIDRRALIPLLAAGATFLTQIENAQAQQFPIPQTAAEVPGPPPGTAMTSCLCADGREHCLPVGLAAVNVANRASLGGTVPVAYNRLAMLTNYISPDQ